MNLINRYIIRQVAFYIFLVGFSANVTLLIFSLLDQASNVGSGDFNVFAFIFYGILTIPQYFYLLMPIAVLVGAVIGMIMLVYHSEYIVMRSSGVSLKSISSSLLLIGVICCIINFVIGEFVAPYTNKFAHIYRLQKLNRNLSISSNLKSGIWVKDTNGNIINLQKVFKENNAISTTNHDITTNQNMLDKIVDLRIYENSQYDINKATHINNPQNMKFIKADYGIFDNKFKHWVLYNVDSYTYFFNNIQIKHLDTMIWKTISLDPAYFSFLAVSVDDMSIIDIIKYIQYLKLSKQSTKRYESALYNRFIYPISCIVMAMIAIIFIPISARSASFGARIFIAIIFGITFFFITKFLNFIALIFGLNSILLTSIPSIFVLLFVLLVMIFI